MENHILVLQCFYAEVTNVFSTHILLDNASHVISPNFKGAEKCNPPSGWAIEGQRKWVDSSNATHLPQKRGEDSQAALCWVKNLPVLELRGFSSRCGTCSVKIGRVSCRLRWFVILSGFCLGLYIMQIED